MHYFTKTLLSWYNENKRDLPWRKSKDPYKIWLSEIMLQQTRVETVIEKYDSFLSRFPTLKSLIESEEDEVLKLWEGLGYYSRALNLRKAAKQIQQMGHFPSNKQELKKLSGIGEYTSGAIASIVFGEKVPAVDGNVYRVLSRYFGIDKNISQSKTQKEFYKLVDSLLPEDRPGDFNQALMDFGSMVCSPKSAGCLMCIFKNGCEAYKKDLVEKLPVKNKLKNRRIKEKTVFLIYNNGKLALTKREKKGILANLYQLPNTSGRLETEKAMEYLRKKNIDFDHLVFKVEKKHIFSHEEWNMRAFELEAKEASAEYIWAQESEIKEKYSIPTAFKQFLI